VAIYAIGDVQGCYDELQALLAKLQFDPSQDTLWFTGDLVNRGPRSLDVLRFVSGLGKSAVTVLGNHDLHLLALAALPGARSKNLDTLDDILKASDCDELLDWLRHQPALHHDAELGYTLVHAGLAPQWDLALAQACARELSAVLRDTRLYRELFKHMYGDKPERWSDDLRGMERLRFITNCFTRLRFCDAEGNLKLKNKGKPEHAVDGAYPWFRVPGRRSKDLRIVFGHWSALGYYREDGVLALDTGCVWGGSLCAARLDRPGDPVMVPCSSSGLRVEE
jgi:bis(5'-nucleosyl)-tetraphosphatase (symmetrical)